MVVLRRPLKTLPAPVPAGGTANGLDVTLRDRCPGAWEYAVLVTSLRLDALAMAQLYRDRADAENSFDELKNQWGWGGFTTQDLDRCQARARTWR